MKMRRSIISFFIVFLILLVPFAYSDDPEMESELEPLNDIKEDIVREIEFSEIKREKLQNAPELDEGIIDEFRILNKSQIVNIMGLNVEKLIRLSEMDDNTIHRLSNLNINGLRKILSLSQEDLLKILDLDDYQLEKISYLDRARFSAFTGYESDKLRSELSKIQVSIVDPQKYFKKRIISEQKITKAEERFQIASQNLLELKKELDSEKRAIIEAEKNEDIEAIAEHSKNYLLNAISAIINHLEKIKNKIQQAQNIEDRIASEQISDINNKIDELERIKLNLEDAEEDQDLVEISRSIKSSWKRLRVKSEYYIRILVNEKIDETIKRSEQLENKLESILTEIEGKGYETKNVETKLGEFSEKIHEARIQFTQSKEKFTQAKSTGIKSDLESKIIESKVLAEDSESTLKEAHQILTGIIKDMRALDPKIDFEKQVKNNILIEELTIEDYIEVEIEGFLKDNQQRLVDILTKNLNISKTSTNIEIEVNVKNQNLELKKEIKGSITDEQKDLLNDLTDGLEDIEEKVIITIHSGEVQ